MNNVELITLIPLLSSAIERYGEETADLAGNSSPTTIVNEAAEMAALGYAHVEGDPKNEENKFAAERFEEAAMMYLCAAKKLRDGNAI